MGASGYGSLGGMNALGGGPMTNPHVVQTYQAMMQNVQKLLAYNPDFLTKGIPNNLLQMCMEQTKMPTMYGVSRNQLILICFLSLNSIRVVGIKNELLLRIHSII